MCFSIHGGLFGDHEASPLGACGLLALRAQVPGDTGPSLVGEEGVGRHCSRRPSPQGVTGPPAGSPTSFSARTGLLTFTPRGLARLVSYRAPLAVPWAQSCLVTKMASSRGPSAGVGGHTRETRLEF